jgi:hypothetical protein
VCSGQNAKRAFLTALWAKLQTTATTPARKATLMTAIRLCLREPVAIEPLCGQDALTFFLAEARLLLPDTAPPPSVGDGDGDGDDGGECADEALKVVINLVTMHEPNRFRFVHG